MWERDPTTLRLTFVNERAERLLGYPATQWLADEGLWERILHPDDRDRVLARVREEVTDGGVDFELSYRLRAADERWVWLHHLGHVARDEDGAARTLHAVLLDVTAAKRREHAAALLAAASQALAAPDTVEERLTAVAELVVGELGDWGAVWLRADDEQYRPFAAAPAGHARRVLALAPVRVPEQFTEQFRAGRAFAVPQVTEGMRREATVDEEHYAALTALGGSCWLVAPLTTGSEPVGLLTVAADAREHDDADVALVADLGQRLATMVAAERQAAQRWALHELSVALSAAGTVAEAAAAVTAGLRRVLGVAVVSVCLLGEDGLLHEVNIAGYPVDRSRDQYAARRLSDPFPLTDAARTRHPIWLPDRAAITSRYPAVAADLLAQTEAVAALPLLAGSRVVGGLATTFRTPRRFDADERTFLLTVAGQIAAAFERAALADVRREMAETLQRSLLPGALPQLDRLAVTARYLPAVAGTQAGGDWYDVLALADGCVAVVVGDVVGHGAPAAAVMGQLRAGLANLLLAGHPPADALELLDGFADQVTGAGVSTVACVVLDPVTRQVTYSRAGHPAPLVIGPPDAGPAGYLDDGLGPALAVHRTRRRPQAVATLPPGATLLLYTDGLVERRRATLDDGLDRLAAAATARGVAPLPALVDGVLGELVAADGAGDDIALVAVRLLPAPLRLDGAGPATALRGAVDRSPR